jgi:hypothetical protein
MDAIQIFLICSSLEVIGGSFGLYGSFWIIYQFYLKKILNNFPGLVIAWTSVADIVSVGYYLTWAIYDLSGDVTSMPLIGYQVLDAILAYSLSVCAFLGLVLSANSFYIVAFPRSLQFYEKWRFLLVPITFLLPLLTIFMPVSVLTGLPFMTTLACKDDTISDGFCFKVAQLRSIALLLTIGVTVGCNLLTYTMIGSHLYKRSRACYSNSESERSVTLVLDSGEIVMKLVMIYSLAICISWLPFFLHLALDLVLVQDPYDSEFRILTVLFWLRCFFVSIRGYIHAFAVYYVARIVSTGRDTKFRLNLSTIFLQIPNVLVDDATSSSTMREVVAPKWDLSGAGTSRMSISNAYFP